MRASWTRGIGAACAAVAIMSAFAAPSFAKPKQTQSLPPDPYMWCAKHPPYQHQTAIGWKVQADGVQGTTHGNDWKCRYWVTVKTPGGYTFPPSLRLFKISFSKICKEQFPGSRVHWVAGPAWSAPWPWECLGDEGRYYPPPS